ncbi:hypothetical protein ACZ11_04000 [Lysinibacillus xylanilyticus]|uniref:DNA helicase n=1 Tax=Lysinibacillus xylanilyticus TaxID=582475 RepID=A0A0K9FBC5_9BACI|nr:AAA family ATPase [Lysinibacillus xylanilyticus]KMY31421.1 hypothetical protein ACZ11_04000 [Lysinibacillus xylanilyticus]
MANSTIMLAAAGSGKTYYVANHLDPNKKNLVITYTNQNVANLQKEIIKKFGEIPINTKVITFSSFIYRWLLKPLEPILKIGNHEGFITTGVEVKKTPEPQTVDKKPNPKYNKKVELKHYIYFGKYYVSRMSSLFNDQKNSVKKIILQRIIKFCDCIYFDELQDFMDADFTLLQYFIKNKEIEVFAVGDFHQHSVSKSNTISSKPFKNGKRYITKEDYINLFPNDTVIDETTLIKSRRVPKEICKLINSKLKIYIDSISEIKGHYDLLTTESQIKDVLNDTSIKKLFYRESAKYTCLPNINWGYSKGDTYKKTCIILTSTFDNLFEDNFSPKKLSPTQINTLYVAITRATHEVYFIKDKDFKPLKIDYVIKN